MAFHLAMILRPGMLYMMIHVSHSVLITRVDVQVKAQSEIDRVVGRDRLPTFQDRDQLPYIGAIVTEVLSL